MKLKSAFKLYRMVEDGQDHIASPSKLIALCGVNTYGMPDVHPDNSKNICPICEARHDNRPGAWLLENNS